MFTFLAAIKGVLKFRIPPFICWVLLDPGCYIITCPRNFLKKVIGHRHIFAGKMATGLLFGGCCFHMPVFYEKSMLLQSKLESFCQSRIIHTCGWTSSKSNLHKFTLCVGTTRSNSNPLDQLVPRYPLDFNPSSCMSRMISVFSNLTPPKREAMRKWELVLFLAEFCQILHGIVAGLNRWSSTTWYLVVFQTLMLCSNIFTLFTWIKRVLKVGMKLVDHGRYTTRRKGARAGVYAVSARD